MPGNKQLEINSSNSNNNSPKWFIFLLFILLVWWIWVGIYFFNFIEKKTRYKAPIVKENNKDMNNTQKMNNEF